MAGGPRAPRARGQYIRRICLIYAPSNGVGGDDGLCTGAFTCVHGRLVAGAGTVSGLV